MLFKKLKAKLISLESKLISLSIVLTGISILGKVVGLAKIHMLARLFGAGHILDIFNAAFALPDFIFTLLVVGTVNAALVPIFIKIIKKDSQETLHQTLTTVIVVLLGSMLLFLGTLYIIMPSVADFLFAQPNVLKAFDLSLDIAKSTEGQYKALFINLSRLMLISPFLLAISSILGAYLQAHKRFIYTALAALMYNVGILSGILLFVRFAPQTGVYALGYSVLLGSTLHLLTQVTGIYVLHEKKLRLSIKMNKYVIEMGKLSLPRIIGLGVEQMAILFNTFWGFTLGGGALSVFAFASTLYLVPVNLISGSFLQVIFPRLNEKAHEDDAYRSLNKLYWRTLVFLFLIIIPVLILFIILKLPIVRLAFGAGRFTWNATVVTSFTLVFFTPAILFQSIAALNIRTFYATNNTKSPFFISIIGVMLNIIFSIGFTNFFSHYHDFITILGDPKTWITNVELVYSWFFIRNGSFASVAGLALGISVGLFFEVLASFIALNSKLSLITYAKSFVQPLKAIKHLLISGIIVTIISYAIYKITDANIDTAKTVNVLLVAGITTLGTLTSYFLLSYNVIKEYVDMKQVLARFTSLFKKVS